MGMDGDTFETLRANGLGRPGRQLTDDQAPVPTGQLTPVPPIPQYPPGFFHRYCWWESRRGRW